MINVYKYTPPHGNSPVHWKTESCNSPKGR